jgi:hypothetical protein
MNKSKRASKRIVRASATPGKKAAKKTTKKAVKKIIKKIAKTASKKSVKKAAKKAAKVVKKVVRKAAKKVAKKVAKKTAKKAAEGTSRRSPKKIAARKSPAPAAPAKAAARPKPTRRPKSFAAAEVTRGFGFPADAPGLPESYGEDRMVLMTKDPEYLFAYWEITPDRLAEGERTKRAGEEYREALRLNWTARDLFDANYALLPVAPAARKWYLRVPHSGLAHQVDIAWLGSQGHFIALLTSNPSDSPESWAATRRRLKGTKDAAAGGVLAYNLEVTGPLGSSELPPAPAEKAPGPPGDWNFGGPGSQDSSFGRAVGRDAPGGAPG